MVFTVDKKVIVMHFNDLEKLCNIPIKHKPSYMKCFVAFWVSIEDDVTLECN